MVIKTNRKPMGEKEAQLAALKADRVAPEKKAEVAKKALAAAEAKPPKERKPSKVVQRATAAFEAHTAKASGKPAKGAAKKKPAGKTASKKTPPKSAPKAAAGPKSGGKEVRPGSKLEIVANLLKSPAGTTTAEILAKTKWPAVSVPEQARAAGLTLRKEKVDGVTRYYAA